MLSRILEQTKINGLNNKAFQEAIWFQVINNKILCKQLLFQVTNFNLSNTDMSNLHKDLFELLMRPQKHNQSGWK